MTIQASSFSVEQLAQIREITREVLSVAQPMLIDAHVNACPWGKQLNRLFYIGMGVGMAFGSLGVLFGVFTIPQLVKLFIEA